MSNDLQELETLLEQRKTTLTASLAKVDAALKELRNGHGPIMKGADPTVGTVGTRTLKPYSLSDQDIMQLAGIKNTGAIRPDRWRKYLQLRKEGKSFWHAAGKAKLHKTTATRLEALV